LAVVIENNACFIQIDSQRDRIGATQITQQASMPLPGGANLGRPECNPNSKLGVPFSGWFFGPYFLYLLCNCFNFGSEKCSQNWAEK
jgi:hypothetical protein